MDEPFELAKYENKYAVYAKSARCFFFIGKGKRFCQKKVKELNKLSGYGQN